MNPTWILHVSSNVSPPLSLSEHAGDGNRFSRPAARRRRPRGTRVGGAQCLRPIMCRHSTGSLPESAAGHAVATPRSPSRRPGADAADEGEVPGLSSAAAVWMGAQARSAKWCGHGGAVAGDHPIHHHPPITSAIPWNRLLRAHLGRSSGDLALVLMFFNCSVK